MMFLFFCIVLRVGTIFLLLYFVRLVLELESVTTGFVDLPLLVSEWNLSLLEIMLLFLGT